MIYWGTKNFFSKRGATNFFNKKRKTTSWSVTRPSNINTPNVFRLWYVNYQYKDYK